MSNTTITQEDREAAANWRAGTADADMTMGDYADLVQAFANHAEQARLAERERCAVLLEDAAARLVKDGEPTRLDEYSAFTLREAAKAIRTPSRVIDTALAPPE